MSTEHRTYPTTPMRWSGLHVDGLRAGEVSRHRGGGSTMMAMVVQREDGTELVPLYERDGQGVMFCAWYRRDQVTPVAACDWFWLTLVGRQRYDGVL